MKTTIEDIGPARKKLLIEVSPEEVKDCLDKELKRLALGAVMPGFRKGKAPFDLLKKTFYDRLIADAVVSLVESAYAQAVKDAGISPVEGPRVELGDFKEGHAFSYSAEVDVRPAFEVKGYADMELPPMALDASEKEVEDALSHLREAHAEFRPVARPAREGDMVTADMELASDDGSFETRREDAVAVVIGDRMIFKEVEEALQGVEAGQSREARVNIPADWKDAPIAGKSAVFKMLARDVKEKALPALDDEFAKDLECSGLEELKERVKKAIIRDKQRAERERQKSEVYERLLRENTFDAPASVVQRHLDSLMKRLDFKEEGARQGAFKDKCREAAEKRARIELILDAIAEKENIEASGAELDEAVRMLAQARGKSQAQMRTELIKERAIEGLRKTLTDEKVMGWILDRKKGHPDRKEEK